MGRFKLLNKDGYVCIKNKHLCYQNFDNLIQASVITDMPQLRNKQQHMLKHYGDIFYLLDIYNLFYVTDKTINVNSFWNDTVSSTLKWLSNIVLIYDNTNTTIKYQLSSTNRIYSKDLIFRQNAINRRRRISNDYVQIDLKAFTPSLLYDSIFNKQMHHHRYIYDDISKQLGSKFNIQKTKIFTLSQIFNDNILNRFPSIQFFDLLYKFKQKIYSKDYNKYITPKGLVVDVYNKTNNLMSKIIHCIQTQFIVQIINDIRKYIGQEVIKLLIYDSLTVDKRYASLVVQLIRLKYNLYVQLKK